MNASNPSQHYTLKVKPEGLDLFTTVLQSGIEIRTESGTSLAAFLTQIPGFDVDYIAQTVQTIFLNGNAIDDLSEELQGTRVVLALSAAMPGLAGAIFRKNGFHAPLRTEVKNSSQCETKNRSTIVVVKMFNSIARERGAELLAQGVTINGKKIVDFLASKDFLSRHIISIESAGEQISYNQLLIELLPLQSLQLQVVI